MLFCRKEKFNLTGLNNTQNICSKNDYPKTEQFISTI